MISRPRGPICLEFRLLSWPDRQRLDGRTPGASRSALDPDQSADAVLANGAL